MIFITSIIASITKITNGTTLRSKPASGNSSQNDLLDAFFRKVSNTPSSEGKNQAACPKTPSSKGFKVSFGNNRQQRKLVIDEELDQIEDPQDENEMMMEETEFRQPTPCVLPEKSFHKDESPVKQFSPSEKTLAAAIKPVQKDTTADGDIKIQKMVPSSESYFFPREQPPTSGSLDHSGLFDFPQFSFGGAGSASSASTDEPSTGFGAFFGSSSGAADKGAGGLGGFLF